MPRAASGVATCSVCGRSFEPRLSYQARLQSDGAVRPICSPLCLSRQLGDGPGRGGATCSVCGRSFEPTLAWQVVGDHRLCSLPCRKQALSGVPAGAAGAASGAAVSRAGRPPRVIAVINQKGGTGKTTTSVQLASAFAERGKRTLLADLDIQGNVGICLGVESDRNAYHVLVSGQSLRSCAVARGERLHVLLGGRDLVQAERALARDEAMGEGFAQAFSVHRGHDLAVIDCGPSLTQLNGAALRAADEVLVPVSCDYLALVGVRQILEVIRNIRSQRGLGVRILGVLPTFFDTRTRISRDVLATLRSYFGERVIPPIRINTRLREAPAEGKTIFEYAPNSRGAQDYGAAAEWILKRL